MNNEENLNKYESIVIIKSDLKKEQKDAVINKFADLIKNNGKLDDNENNGITILGTKKLAYEIKGNIVGYYVEYEFASRPEFIRELERIYRITDDVIKFIVVRKDE